MCFLKKKLNYLLNSQDQQWESQKLEKNILKLTYAV